MDFQRVAAVFQLVTGAVGFPRQLARLADWNEADVEQPGNRCSEDEDTSFYSNNKINIEFLYGAASASIEAAKAAGLLRTGVMSLNWMPGLGKSGTLRMQSQINWI